MHSIGSALNQTVKRATGTKQVQFSRETPDDNISVIYDSGADGHYITKEDCKQATLPILRKLSKKVNVANGKTCKAKFITQLPFQTRSTTARTADTFTEFLHSLMSVGKTSDNGIISIFKKKGVMVHKEQDVLIRMKGKPFLIGFQYDHGQNRIPLIQQCEQWLPRRPS